MQSREPASILILTAGFGEGHNAAARNLLAGLEELAGEEVRVAVHDPYRERFGRFAEFARRTYLGLINRTPALWNRIYAWADRHPATVARGPGSGRLARHFGHVLRERRPSVVASVYPAFNHLLQLLPDPLPPRVTFVTDSISINRIWTTVTPHPFIAPNRATAAQLVAQGIPAHLVHSLGFPVPLAFVGRTTEGDRPDLSEGGQPRVLYIINSGKHQALDVVRTLLGRPSWRCTIAVGRDERLLRRVQRIAGGRADVLGWTDRIPELLLSHHVVISKAGGATTQEAIAALTPMIVNQVVPGQEEGNWELLRQAGAGALATTPAAIVSALDAAFADAGAGWYGWQRALHPISFPESALHGARFILEVARGDPTPA